MSTSGIIIWEARDEDSQRGYLAGSPETTLFLIVPANPSGDVRLLGWCVPDATEKECWDFYAAKEAAEDYLHRWLALAVRQVKEFLPRPEVTPPSFTETMADGRVVVLHPRRTAELGAEARSAVQAVHVWTDHSVAEELKSGGFHPGTALAVMMLYRDAVASLDAKLAESCTPRLTEIAASARPMVAPLREEA